MIGSSWRTTLSGVLLAVGTALFGAHVAGVVELANWVLVMAIVLQAAGGGLIGVVARDNKVTSEQAGVGAGEGLRGFAELTEGFGQLAGIATG